MLIVDPNSTCDICMESYMDGAHMPYAITCGHIFCRACLDSMQTQCPLCRDRFSRRDIRELRVDSGAPSSRSETLQVDTQVEYLLDDIANTANGDTTLEEMQRVVDLCNAYHIAQPDTSDLHTSLGIGYLLLSAPLEARTKLHSQAEQLSEHAAAKDDICGWPTLELEAIQVKFQYPTHVTAFDRWAYFILVLNVVVSLASQVISCF